MKIIIIFLNSGVSSSAYVWSIATLGPSFSINPALISTASTTWLKHFQQLIPVAGYSLTSPQLSVKVAKTD